MDSQATSFEVFGELPVELHDDERLLTIVRDVGPPPKPGGSRRKFGQRQKDWVVGFVAQLPSPQLAARMLGISTSTIHHGRRTDPEFKAAYDEAISLAREHIVGVAYQEALGIGKDYVLSKDSKVVAIPKRRDSQIIRSVLDLHYAREKNTHEIRHTMNNGSQLGLTSEQLMRLSRQERKQLTELLLKATSPKDVTPDRQQLEYTA